jgi:UDP-3-O-acyl N-acetylglucosamine deacetylase
LLSSSSFRGTGLHTGAASVVTLHPGTPGAGIIFRLPDGSEIPAHANYVVDTARCTVLGKGTARVSTVEHLLSACIGLGISDLTVAVEGPEIPIGDGSAACWIETLRAAGLAPLPQVPIRALLTAPVIVTGKDGAFVAAYPSDRLRVTVAIHFSHPLVGTQIARYVPDETEAPTDYAHEIADARTFGFIEEVEALLAAGLARGGTLDNAVVIYPDHFSMPLRFDNELARHKLLDVLGDLALWGSALLPNADIIAVKPSHRLNTELALRLREARGDGLPNED